MDLCWFVPAEEDELWAERAQGMTASQVKLFAKTARRITRSDAAAANERRAFYLRWDEDDDLLRFHGRLAGANGAALKKIIERMTDRATPDAAGNWPTLAQRQADALVELAQTRIAKDPDADRATVVVHVDSRELNYINGKAKFEDGPLVGSEVARRLCRAGYLEAIFEGPDGKPFKAGRRTRIVPPHIYRELKKRDDDRCVCCGGSIGKQAHHVNHWAHGGNTDIDNLVLLCRRCHKLVHEGGFRLSRNQLGEVLLIRPDGRPVLRGPVRLRPDVRERMLGPPNRVR